MGIAVRYAPPPSLSSWLASHRRRSHLGRAEDICTRGPRGTLPASAASSTPGWGVRSPGSAAHDAEHATTPRRQTEPERSPSAPGRSRSRPSVPPDWSRRFARSGKVASAVGRDIWLLSIVLLRFQTCAVPRECGVLPTAGSLGSCPESSCEFLRLRSVFPHAAVISASSTKRKLCDPKQCPSPGERYADYGANRATIAITKPTTAGRSAGSASEAAHSFGKPRVGGEARGSPPAGRHGFENWRQPDGRTPCNALKRRVSSLSMGVPATSVTIDFVPRSSCIRLTSIGSSDTPTTISLPRRANPPTSGPIDFPLDAVARIAFAPPIF